MPILYSNKYNDLDPSFLGPNLPFILGSSAFFFTSAVVTGSIIKILMNNKKCKKLLASKISNPQEYYVREI